MSDISIDVVRLCNDLVFQCHSVNKHFWRDLHRDTPLQNEPRIVPEKLMLIVSEIAEAMEGHRKDTQDTHLPRYKTIEVELADALIRIFDLAGAMDYDVGSAMRDKLLYNQTRADHKKEARLASGGKAY